MTWPQRFVEFFQPVVHRVQRPVRDLAGNTESGSESHLTSSPGIGDNDFIEDPCLVGGGVARSAVAGNTHGFRFDG